MRHIVQAASIRWYNACAYYAVTLAEGLSKTGRRVTFAGAAGSAPIEKAEAKGLDTLALDQDDSGIVAQYRMIQRCRRFAIEEGVDLVNVHAGKDHLLWMLALRGTGIPVIRTSGNQIAPKNHPAARLMMRKTKGVIVSCRTIQGYYSERFCIDKNSIPVINGAVDTDYFTPDAETVLTRRELGIDDNAFLFGILARYSPDKGHSHFFRAAGEVVRTIPEARFLIAGWQAQLSEEDMCRMAAEAGILDRAIFLGRQRDTRDIIALIDAGVISSVNSETICRIAMEYMAMKIPVVASDTNVIPEVVVDGETGLVVKAGDSDAMARAMIQLAGDRGLCRSFAEAGYTKALNELSLEAFAEKNLAVFRGVTA